MEPLKELAEMARTRPEQLKQKKKEGAKLVGYTGRFIPEEIIRASGAVPFYLCRGGEPEPPEAVLPYLLRFMSPFSRAQIGYHILNMDPVMPLLDLIIAQCDDCHMTRLADMFEYFNLPTMRLGVPPDWKKPRELTAAYYFRGLTKLRDKLNELTGNEITDHNLRESIDSANRIRGWLQNINLMRKQQPPPIGGYDYIRLNHYLFYSEPEPIIDKLKILYSQLEAQGAQFDNKTPRILLAGHVVAVGDYAVPRLIEDSGGVIVAEFMDEGHYHCMCNVKTEGDLMQNIGETYYLERIPPTIFQPAWADRIEYLKKLITDYQVDGVIWYQLSFEELYDMESSIVAKAMDELKMPLLKLESAYEYTREAMGPLTTRIESFIAAIKQRGAR